VTLFGNERLRKKIWTKKSDEWTHGGDNSSTSQNSKGDNDVPTVVM
jgi:hypothetical protein